MNATSINQIIQEAAEPVSQFWPMKGYVSHNPLQGLEHLPFDEAFRQAKGLFGAEGYLPLPEYRSFYQNGRITRESLGAAMALEGPVSDESITMASRTITASEVYKLNLLHGIDPIEPVLFDWHLQNINALEQPQPGSTTDLDLGELWQKVLAVLDLSTEITNDQKESDLNNSKEKIELPFRRTLSDWIDELTEPSIVAAIDQHLIKWTSSFTDEGMAGWSMPDRQAGFYRTWRELAQHDVSGRFQGISNFSGKIAALPDDPESAIQKLLMALQIPNSRWPDYLMRSLSQLPGWTGLIRWRGLNQEDPIQKAAPIDIMQYLAVRLFYERELVELSARQKWGVDGNLTSVIKYLKDNGKGQDARTSVYKASISHDAWRLFHLLQLLDVDAQALSALSSDHANKMLHWLNDFDAERQLPVWLEAYEDSFRKELLSKIHGHQGTEPKLKERPLAQAAFCIDVRSEPLRHNLEAAGPIETFGYAGFFGIPISHRSYDAEESFPLCPVLLSPANATYELPRTGQQEALSNYASGSRWLLFGEKLFHDMKHSPVASFLLVDVLGLFFSIALLGKTLFRRSYNAVVRTIGKFFRHPFTTEILAGDKVNERPKVRGVPVELTQGFSIQQQADFIEGGLRMIGLTENFGRFVMLCGHGSTTDNNPYSAALDCGACGGRHGDPNARTFAVMANNSLVRDELQQRGLHIPQDTWFLPAKHDTTSDKVDFYDVIDIPESHRDDFEKLNEICIKGGEQQALERCKKIPGAPKNMTAKEAFAHVESRSFDWANSRPEWGLSGNAAFIVGRRAMTKGLSLGGRCFMHSYDCLSDPEGVFLEKIMTAPLVVTEWINMQYYTSATDPWKYGSGSKVIHNVVGGVGVMYGAQSDLATGLPLQTVNDGDAHFHEPMRLLILIEANKEIISEIIGKHEVLQKFFNNGWLNLVAVDSNSFDYHRYNKDMTWELIEL